MSGRVLITGASGALGRSVVERFLAAGDGVLAVGATEAALAELTPLGPAETADRAARGPVVHPRGRAAVRRGGERRRGAPGRGPPGRRLPLVAVRRHSRTPTGPICSSSISTPRSASSASAPAGSSGRAAAWWSRCRLRRPFWARPGLAGTPPPRPGCCAWSSRWRARWRRSEDGPTPCSPAPWTPQRTGRRCLTPILPNGRRPRTSRRSSTSSRPPPR